MRTFLGKYCLHLGLLLLSLSLGFACKSKQTAPQPQLGTPPDIRPMPTPPIPDPDPDPSPAPPEEEARRQIVDYFRTQLDEDRVTRAPSFLYGQKLEVEAFASTQQELWTLWREANSARLEASGFLSLQKEMKEIIWDIPAGQRMKFNLLPKGDKPRQGYPLFINLHGGGKADVQEPWASVVNDIAWEAETNRSLTYQDAPSLHFVPRMADDRIGRWYLAPQRNAFRRAYQLGVLSDLVDPERVYILGTSEGGYGAHRLALFMPDIFAGAGPMAAAEPLYAPENLRNIAFGLQMGANDHGFKRAKFAHLWQDKLNELQEKNPQDYIHRIEIEEGREHGDINFAVMTPWLSQHKRRNYPERLSFLYYNMTQDYPQESYAQTHYYLDFRKLKHTPNAAMLFEVEHQGNEYHIRHSLREGTKVWGELGLYLNEQIDFSKNVRITLNGTEIFKGKVSSNKGVMTESIALWGDPKRIYPAKLNIPIL